MGTIIEHNDIENENTVRVGETNTQVSAKVYQDIYHQITGRTEQIRRRYSENILIDFSEIEQLHYKIHQLCDIHNVIASNEVIAIFMTKNDKSNSHLLNDSDNTIRTQLALQ